MKKFLKGAGVVVIVLAALLVYGIYLSNTKDLPPEIVIDGKEFSTGDTVQDLLDAGFLIGNIEKDAYDVEKLEDIKGKTYSAEFYCIGKEGKKGAFEYTGVIVSLYNDSAVGCPFSQGKIYDFRYSTDPEDKTCDVTINGIDFSGMNKEEAVAAFEETGMPFEEDEKEDFFSGERGSLYADTKNYFYILDDYDGELDTIEVKKNLH